MQLLDRYLAKIRPVVLCLWPSLSKVTPKADRRAPKNGHAVNKVREDPRTQIFVKARTSDRKFSLKRKYMCTCGELEKDPRTQIFVQGRTPNGKFSSKGKKPYTVSGRHVQDRSSRGISLVVFRAMIHG